MPHVVDLLLCEASWGRWLFCKPPHKPSYSQAHPNIAQGHPNSIQTTTAQKEAKAMKMPDSFSDKQEHNVRSNLHNNPNTWIAAPEV